MPRSYRVLHLHKITGIGGSERHLLTLLPALRARGVDARFLGLDVAGSDAPRFYAELEAAGIPARHVRCATDVSPRLAAAVIRAVRDERPDLLHTHLVHADVYGSAAARTLRIPHVSTRHNDDPYLAGPFRHVDRAFASRARRLVAISHAVRDFLVTIAGYDGGRVETIHYGLDGPPSTRSEITPAQAGVPAAGELLLAAGRLTEQKDHATALRAFAVVRKRRPDVCLAILGGGPLAGETRQLARTLGVEEAVFLPGRVELADWLDAATVFVHPSRWEGFGMVLLEAMLAGLPIAATRASAIPEVVSDGVTGLLVAPGDWRGLAAALDELVGDRERAVALGTAGRERARRRFSVERMTARTLALYDDVLGSAT
jgi:glycosyltransferase involved in cell wall biosynthesis